MSTNRMSIHMVFPRPSVSYSAESFIESGFSLDTIIQVVRGDCEVYA